MKRLILCLGWAFALLTGCRKSDISDASEQTNPAPVLRIRTVISGVTRSFDDAAISRLQMLVFDSQGTLETSWETEAWDGSHDLELTLGQKTVCLIANAAAVSGIHSLSDLDELSFDYRDCSPGENGGLLMTGSGSCQLTGGTRDVRIVLQRRAVKIQLLPVQAEGLGESLQKRVHFRAAFLTNVRSSVHFFGQERALSSLFLYAAGCQDGQMLDAYATDYRSFWEGYDAVLAEDLCLQTNNLYCFPNENADTSTDYSGADPAAFTPSLTRLVVEAITDSGQRWYYPIRLPAPLLDNHIYQVHLTVTGPGSAHPNLDPVSETYQSSFSILPWQEQADYQECL